ncbi:NAD-glutamate dehydrogenase [Longispora sp. K20-0274]|uniref:NAD-glutamate dehydrogenase n=1 Tax=Longispora sp. K20-0274 TaxID=3088255 RepID=UPI003999AADB
MERHQSPITDITEALSGIGFDDEAELDAVLNRDRLIADACDLAEQLDEQNLVELYWRYVRDEELTGWTPHDVLRGALAHRQFASQRVPGRQNLNITSLDSSGRSTILLVTDDMPFLVDSLTAALAGEGFDIHLLVHPQVVVSREPLGRLSALYPAVEPDDATGEQLVESWMRIEVDRVRDDAQAAGLRNAIQRVLTDVREVNEDWPKLRHRALSLADELVGAKLPVPDKDINDTVELLRWLAQDNFTLLGYREYDLVDGEYLQAKLGTGLGILRQDSPQPRALSSMTPEAYAKALDQRLLIITKANSRATVHRTAYLDYIGVKTFDATGQVSGERRFLGLFGSGAYLHSVRELPVIRRKVDEVLNRSGLSPRSHSGKDLMEVLETYPRDELFQISTFELFHTAMGVLRLAGRRQLKLFVRRDAYGRFISCMVYLPRDRFTTGNRLRMQEILLAELNGIGVDYTTRVSESTLARVHFIVRTDPAAPPGEIDADVISEKLSDATRLWDDDFRLVLDRHLGGDQEKRLFARYIEAYPQTYKDEHTPTEAAKDVAKLELVDEPGELALHLFRRRKNDAGLRFKVFRFGESMVLSEVLPVLHSLGFKVTDERPYEIRRSDGTVYLYDFGLVAPEDSSPAPEIRATVENAFSAAWHGEAEVDGLNQLVLRAGLSWRQVVVLRAYAKYLHQAGTVFSQEYMEKTFIAYPGAATLLVALFEVRFDPRIGLTEEARAAHADELVMALNAELDEVASRDQGRILRSFLTLIQATLRTSFFQRSAGGRPKSYVAFKLNPEAIPDLPQPRPKFEIWVYSPRFEGVHLRFGAVARGGLRWSDRRDDFRTELLTEARLGRRSLVTGSTAAGGFVLKQAPAASDRDAFFAEGVDCYKLFISALLDVTDNLVAGKIVPPAEVVRHDGDDPYLVVAADKGTATFSDTANGISEAYGFWLGDAFASGGSAGYDHKKMGITAKGAWESVKRHFREMGLNTQTEEFTVVGVGDMSGDVFGNGMLLSEHIRLVAAFDHRHIFLDPNPVAAVSFAERQRLFDVPRSSWDDYDKSLISAGGGVFARTLKSIPLSAEVRAALGIDDSVTELSPPDLMKAILKAPVDLFWNGGIGTYVKASLESHADVGDKANDAIRVNGKALRVKVVGEGGNLGCTQRGRIEYSRAGGHINTDAIDNSAGVDCSERETNNRIVLDMLVANGEITAHQRSSALETIMGEVAELVLNDQRSQVDELGHARARAYALLPAHRRLIAELERSTRIDREHEALPTDAELQARLHNGMGLTTPEYAVLLTHAKYALEEQLHAAGVGARDWANEYLLEYFPPTLRNLDRRILAAHILAEPITVKMISNEVIRHCGAEFVFLICEEMGTEPDAVIAAYTIIREVLGLPEIWRGISIVDGEQSAARQLGIQRDVREMIDRSLRWLLHNRTANLDVRHETDSLARGIATMTGYLATAGGQAWHRAASRQNELAAAGLPDAIARKITALSVLPTILDCLEITQRVLIEPHRVVSTYCQVADLIGADELHEHLCNLTSEEKWRLIATESLRRDLGSIHSNLVSSLLGNATNESSQATCVIEWEKVNRVGISEVRRSASDLSGTNVDLARIAMILRRIRNLSN